MFKTLLVSGAVASAAAVLASPAQAEGFYLNPEFNAGWSGSDFTGSVLEGHVGWEKGGLYLQGGPALAQPDGGDAEVGLSGKMGIGASVSESFDVYGEVSAAKFDDVDAGYGLKVGGKYKF
jgi:hypothetical protein|tara:strand:- start:310 stop:672 length:363 start_codon:yes stop_codon:yes gene_type:complete